MDNPERKPIDPTMITRSRQLRRAITPMEARLWYAIRNRSLSGLKFRRQHVIGPYIADFVCIAAKLVIELDGPSHDGDDVRDTQRTQWIGRHGYRIIRFTNQDVHDNVDGVCEAIMAACTP